MLLRHLTSVEAVSKNNIHLQNELFHQDYYNSLIAGFKRETYEQILSNWNVKNVEMFRMRILPFLMCIKSINSTTTIENSKQQMIQNMIDNLHPDIRKDFNEIKRCFKYGGLKPLYI